MKPRRRRSATSFSMSMKVLPMWRTGRVSCRVKTTNDSARFKHREFGAPRETRIRAKRGEFAKRVSRRSFHARPVKRETSVTASPFGSGLPDAPERLDAHRLTPQLRHHGEAIHLRSGPDIAIRSERAQTRRPGP